MKKQLLTNMLAAIAALFIVMFAMPQKAMAQQNTVTIDGVKKTILSTDFLRGDGDDNAFAVYLYLSSDKKEYVQVRGNKKLHAIYGPIWLDKKEEKHVGKWYWDVIYTSYGKEKFWASGNPLDGYALFSSGYMLIYGDPRSSRKICGIDLLYGKVTDTKNGDGQEHTITIDYQHERTKPSAGTFTVGTVTATWIDLSWTHGSDETTPRANLFYTVDCRKVGDNGWWAMNAGNATSYTIIGLEPETEYEVTIGVYDESGNYTSYGVQTVTTKQDTQAPSAPAITSMTSTPTKITVNWTKCYDNVTPQNQIRYRVWCGLAGGNVYSAGDIVTNQTSYTVTGLEPDTEYTLYVMAFDKAGNYTESAKKTIRTQAVVEAYGIQIGGVEITAANYTDISASNGFPAVKSGTVSYNPATRTLTLDNAVIEGQKNVIKFYANDHSTLVLKGNGNRLTSASSASSTLSTRSNLTITGGGSAQIISKGAYGIFVNTDTTLTITGGCSITAEGKFGIAGRVGSSGTLIIDGATVKAKGTLGSVCYFKEIVLKNCAITAPSGATVERGNVKLGGSVCTKQVVIEPTGTPQASNTVRIDGVEKPVLETKYETSGKEDFTIYLYLSEDNKEHIKINGKKSKHFNKDIDLTKIEPATYYLEISYQTGGRLLFDGYLSPANGLAFTTGTFRIDGDPAGTFTITLNDGKITDVDYGDGKEHTFSIKCSYVPPAGIDAPTADVPARKQGVYNLQGVRLGTSLDRLPKGIYVVDGRKVVKR